MLLSDLIAGRVEFSLIEVSEFSIPNLMLGCYTNPHKDFNQITCIDYAGAFVVTGEVDPIEKQMDIFLKEEVEFDMPEGVRSWKQNSKIQVQGNLAKKTVVRTLKMKDGREDTLTKTLEKKFEL